MSEQSSMDRPPEDSQETEPTPLPAKKWLYDLEHYAYGGAEREKEQGKGYWKRYGDLALAISSLLRSNPIIDADLQNEIEESIISPFASSDDDNKLNEGMVAMQVATYLHNLPTTEKEK